MMLWVTKINIKITYQKKGGTLSDSDFPGVGREEDDPKEEGRDAEEAYPNLT